MQKTYSSINKKLECKHLQQLEDKKILTWEKEQLEKTQPRRRQMSPRTCPFSPLLYRASIAPPRIPEDAAALGHSQPLKPTAAWHERFLRNLNRYQNARQT